MDIKNFDFKQLNLIKAKKSKTEKYIICDKFNKKIHETLDEVYVPFGIEKWNNTQLLNIEINPNKNNKQLNINALLKSYDDIFREQIKLHHNVDNKTYYSFLKDSKYGCIMRTHISDYPKITKCSDINSGSDIIKMTSADIVKNNVKITLSLSTLWFTDISYGVTWDVVSMELL